MGFHPRVRRRRRRLRCVRDNPSLLEAIMAVVEADRISLNPAVLERKALS